MLFFAASFDIFLFRRVLCVCVSAVEGRNKRELRKYGRATLSVYWKGGKECLCGDADVVKGV